MGRPRRTPGPGGEGEAAKEAPRYHTRAIDRLDESVDPALQRWLFRWETSPLIRESPPLPQYIREPTIHLDPRRFYAGYLGVRDEVEIPHELRRDLKEQVPQALLRDLHRVVRGDIQFSREPMEPERDPGGTAAYKAAKAAQRREPLPVIYPMVEVVIEAQARRRNFLSEPWKATLRDDEERRHNTIEGGF